MATNRCFAEVPINNVIPFSTIPRCSWMSLLFFSYKNTCTITYNAVHQTGWYGVAVQIEDYSRTLGGGPLSNVPLQFLVYVYSSADSCEIKTEYVGNTLPDKACIGVPENGTLNSTVAIRVLTPGVR